MDKVDNDFEKNLDFLLKMEILLFLFKNKINHKIEKENQFGDAINIDSILKDKLNLLKEDYSEEADGDYVFD